MQKTTSADGTTIAYDVIGEGPAVLITGGAFSTADVGRELAASLSARGFGGVVWDRRGRGSSSDTAPYSPAREVDDLAAVIDAVEGVAGAVGHSSGAVLTLLAAASGAPILRPFLSEPPFRFGVDEPASDLATRMQAAIDDGRPGDAVVLFQREGVGLPDAMIEQFRQSPMFGELLPLAQSAVYDQTLVASVSTPTDAMLGVPMPVAVMRGERTFPMLVTAADRLARELPHGELVVSAESVDHRLDPEAAATVIAERLRP